MSSSPRDEVGSQARMLNGLRSGGGWRPRTLRTKLVAGIVALIVSVCALIGVVTEIVLSHYLTGQLDEKVIAFAGGLDGPRGGDGSLSGRPIGGTPAVNSQRFAALSSCPVPAGGEYRPGPSEDQLVALVAGDNVAHAVLRRTGGDKCTTLPTSSSSALAAVGTGAPQTVSVGDAGVFRVVRVARVDTAGDALVVGLPYAQVSDTQVRIALTLAVVAGAAVLLGGLIVYGIVARSVRPLERVAATARQVSTLPLDRGEVDLGVRVPDRDTDPRTEIGQVGAALNQMLGHVSGALQARHTSELQVRQFVGDASHELRTPLAAIRGYAELARRGGRDAETVAHALRRVEAESERMTALVEDLLLLARLDAGRPLAAEIIDLTVLVIDRVSDARVAGPEHRWQLELPADPVRVTGDEARLHQVVANLLANARNHTPPGTAVTVGLHPEGGGVALTVTDDGPGIPPALQPEIFHRFVRGDSSRSRAAGSTGLGLAIVDAVVASHGGAVAIDSRPGFTQVSVWLPATVSDGSQPTDSPMLPRAQLAGRISGL